MFGVEYIPKKSALNKNVFLYSIQNKRHTYLTDFFEEAFEFFSSKTGDLLKRFHSMKTNFCLVLMFKKHEIVDTVNGDKNEEKSQKTEYKTYYLRTDNYLFDAGSNLEEEFNKNIIEIFFNKIDNIQECGSGWSLDEVLRLDIYNFKYVCFNGSQKFPLPKFIASKKAVINIQNDDNECFRWAILAALHAEDIGGKNADRVSKYVEFYDELDFSGIKFPVELKLIEKFEKQNNNISVNVYGVENELNHKLKERRSIIVPIRLTKQIKTKHIHLLLLKKVETITDKEIVNIRDNVVG